jgi:hypothetical protein
MQKSQVQLTLLDYKKQACVLMWAAANVGYGAQINVSLTATNIQITVLGTVTPSNLVVTELWDTCCLHFHGRRRKQTPPPPQNVGT